MVPVTHVLAIYSRENGQGMSFPFDVAKSNKLNAIIPKDDEKPKAGRPSLTIVK
jgi:stringent starvation protein B